MVRTQERERGREALFGFEREKNNEK